MKMYRVSLFVLLFTMVPVAKPTQCLRLLCDPDHPECHECTNVTADQLVLWQKYIDVLLLNSKNKEIDLMYYKSIQKRPFCCKPDVDELCSLRFLYEPKLPPHRFYELGCQKGDNLFKSIACQQNNARCCNTTLCNLPSNEEISKLIVDTPKDDNMLIVILPAVLIFVVVVVLSGCCLWGCRRRAARKNSSQMNPVVGGAIGDCFGQRPTDARSWHVEGGPGVGAVTTGTTPTPTQLIGGAHIESHYLLRTPLLSGNLGCSSMSSAVMTKPIRALVAGGSSYYNNNGLNSIGSGVVVGGGGGGSTIARGSECVGGVGGGGGSYAATLLSSGGGTMYPASYSAPTGTGPDLRTVSSGSGSGAGQPLLVERTVARQVRLERRIGEGRYGDVWLGRLHCDQVAVKIFSSRNENSWIRERDIYETATLRHTNILGFIAADNKDNGISTELWLITEYHRLGSLYEFLKTYALTLPTLIKMASSIANGLAHLHMPIIGTSGKPPIAHRDLKSRNILVKADGECCIGDLGFAVKLDVNSGQVDVAHNPERVGTKRYMAPEVLDNTLQANSFDAYMQADIYSLGLVFWEMTHRVCVPNFYGPEEYQLPYQDNVSSDPLIEEMKSVVCELGLRPHLPPIWQDDPALHLLYHIMSECWVATPSHRLSAMRIKKDLGNQRQQLGPPSVQVTPQSIEDPLSSLPPSNLALPPGTFVFHSTNMEKGTSLNSESPNQTSDLHHRQEEEPAVVVQPPNVVSTLTTKC